MVIYAVGESGKLFVWLYMQCVNQANSSTSILELFLEPNCSQTFPSQAEILFRARAELGPFSSRAERSLARLGLSWARWLPKHNTSLAMREVRAYSLQIKNMQIIEASSMRTTTENKEITFCMYCSSMIRPWRRRHTPKIRSKICIKLVKQPK